MGMTNREMLRAAVNEMNSDGGVPNEKWNTILLTSIANSLAIIADVLTDKKMRKLIDDYESKSKAMLEELLSEVNKLYIDNPLTEYEKNINEGIEMAADVIQQKIDKLREGEL